MATIKETLSSNTLFHFTKSREILTLILTNEFSPRYCLEDFTMLGITEADKTALELAVPMICFCDIPLSKIRYHLSCYGNYGIGMKKSWGIKKRVTPIIYASPKSETISLIKEMLKIRRWSNLR
ncbi:abortive infection system antitoxin AbiGi family protein [Hymenobacter sp. IS2118]|uniref:abortive infection system antitoxin AbiGi family protein n=1 Tax=Hymenobacter sp. IS2118 TaxID=1505605 RepID=UPI0009075152